MANPKRKKPRDVSDQEPPKEREENLDEFLAGMFQQTATGEENAMPSLDNLKAKFKTKSAAIRHLHFDLGFDVKTIHKHLNLRYQHVRNVISKELKRGPNEDFHLGEGQAAKIVETGGDED